LFGVGAPEALVIGVVALLVFGPKGLADIAKQLGSTLRAFQPTIRELQEVSREFKETLEDEIGLDEIRNGTPTPTPRKPTPTATAAPAEDAPAPAGESEEVTEAMKKAAAEAAWGTPVSAATPTQTETPLASVEVPSDISAEETEGKP
jgi:TatA/E family protein of Tat protein translocase